MAAVWFRTAGLALILGTVAVGPFFQGLFFAHQQHPAQVAVGLGFLLWLIGWYHSPGGAGTGPGGIEQDAIDQGGISPGRIGPGAVSVAAGPHPGPVNWRDPLTLATLALLGSYLLASVAAVYPQGHLEMLLNLGATLLAFVAVRAEAATRPGLRPWLAGVLGGSGVAVALVSLAPYVGLASLDPKMVEALALVGGNGRLGGPFQYWNTAAIYFVAVLILLAGLAVNGALRPLPLVLAAAAGFTPMLAFVLAASRGAVLVLPVALALFLLGLPRSRRLPALLLLLVALVPALAASRGFAANAALGDVPRVLKWFLAGQAAAVLGGLALALWVRIPGRVQAALAGGGLAVAALGAGVLAVRLGGVALALERLLPDHARRLLDMSWRTPNALLRLYYDRDALRMLQDRPLLGAGGRSWERLYFQYQDFYYYATEVHNGYLQVAVEAGLPALLALVGFAVAVFWKGWQAARSGAATAPVGAVVAPVGAVRTGRPGSAGVNWTLTSAALAVLGHSVIDFDLSYLSILLLVWVLAGAGTVRAAPETPASVPALHPTRHATDQSTGLGQRRFAGALCWTAMGLVVLFLATAGSQGLAATALRQGEALAAAGQWAGATAAFTRAARLAPLSATAREALARAHSANPEELTWLEAAVRLDPQNHLLHQRVAQYHRQQRNWPAAAAAAIAALERQPSYYENYELALIPLMEAAVTAVLDGRRDEGLALAREARQWGDELLARRERTEGQKGLWRDAQPRITPAFLLWYGQALALTDDPEAALPRLRAAAGHTPLRIQAEIWTYLVLEQLGRPADAKLAGRPWIRALHVNPLRNILARD